MQPTQERAIKMLETTWKFFRPLLYNFDALPLLCLIIIHIYGSGIMSAFVENKSFLICVLLDNLTP